MKKVKAPQVTKTSTMTRDDLRIIPGDERTAKALREIGKEGKVSVREVNQSWPKILVYDVDKDIGEEELAIAIRRHNEDTGLEEGD